MPLVFALFAVLVPRITMVLLWLFTYWFNGVFKTLLWPLLGFVFLPTTTLWYSAVQHWFGGQWSIIPLIGLAIAIVLDLSPGSYRRRRVQST